MSDLQVAVAVIAGGVFGLAAGVTTYDVTQLGIASMTVASVVALGIALALLPN